MDSLFGGKLVVHQDRKGYRFSLDAVLIAGLSNARSNDRVADLGTGCAVILLIMAYRKLGARLVGLELQPELADLALRNVQVNGFSDLVEIMKVDLRHVSDQFPPSSFDLVVSNPPYRRVKTGRINPEQQKALARHELTASVSDIFAAGSYLLSSGGRLAVIYPATRLDYLMVTARQHDFRPKELTVIYSNSSSPGRLVHVEFRKGGGEELLVAPPFFIHKENGTYSEAMQRLYQ
ncbi:MAG: tRNA1(Val) (adenine(37)-N6)-methyltransferase [Syntrophobacteraceae bacterium]